LAWQFPYHQAVALSRMGDGDRAISALEKMAPSDPARVGLALAVPEFVTHLETIFVSSRFAGKSDSLSSVNNLIPSTSRGRG